MKCVEYHIFSFTLEMSDTVKVLANKSTLYGEHVSSHCCSGKEESGGARGRAQPF